MDRFEFDDDYVRRLRAGDRETVDHFYAYFNQAMLLKLRSRLRTMDEIEDVRQDTFARVWQKLPDLRDSGALGSFCMVTCEHALLEFFRRRQRYDRTEPAPEIQIDPDRLLRELIQSEDAARVRRVLARMEPRDRTILHAYFLDEKPKDDICREFGVDCNYLRVLLYRAKKKFKELFERKSTPPFLSLTMIFVTVCRLWSPRL